VSIRNQGYMVVQRNRWWIGSVATKQYREDQ
jgi:hypothetical protein